MASKSAAYLPGGLRQFFSFEGRVRRSTFWVNLLVFGFASFLINLWCVQRYTSFYDLQEHTYITNKPIYFAAVILIGLRVLSISIRRWHDLDKSGWLAALNVLVFLGSSEMVDLPDNLYWGWLLLSAVISLIILGFQGFVPGDQESNQYGLPPEEGQWF